MNKSPEFGHAWYEVECSRVDLDSHRSVLARFALKACDEEMAIGLVDQHLTDEIFHVSLGGWKPKTMAEVYGLPEAGQSLARPLAMDFVALFSKSTGDHVRLITYEEQQKTE